jgi:hypothetical protein
MTTARSAAEEAEEEQAAEDKRAKWDKGDRAVELLPRGANPRKPRAQPENRFGLLQSEDEDAHPMEEVGLGREVPEKQKRPLSQWRSVPCPQPAGVGRRLERTGRGVGGSGPAGCRWRGATPVDARGHARERPSCSYEQPHD